MDWLIFCSPPQYQKFEEIKSTAPTRDEMREKVSEEFGDLFSGVATTDGVTVIGLDDFTSDLPEVKSRLAGIEIPVPYWQRMI